MLIVVICLFYLLCRKFIKFIEYKNEWTMNGKFINKYLLRTYKIIEILAVGIRDMWRPILDNAIIKQLLNNLLF